MATTPDISAIIVTLDRVARLPRAVADDLDSWSREG